MSSKKEFKEACERMLWVEKEMRDSYSDYKNYLKDEELLRSIKEIEDDEIRHINMAERILLILRI